MSILTHKKTASAAFCYSHHFKLEAMTERVHERFFYQ